MRRKLSRLTRTISTSAQRIDKAFEVAGRIDPAKAAAEDQDALFRC